LNREYSAVREGLLLVCAIEVVAGATAVVFWPAGVCLAVGGLAVALFFRDPRREGPVSDSTLIAPIDGRIVEVRAPAEGRPRATTGAG